MRQFFYLLRSLISSLRKGDLKYRNQSFSQEGEDMILKRIFEEKEKGFYVDIGAHHPFRFSNTYHFYQKGWRGINVEPMPGTIDLFNKYRKEDINLNFGVSNTGEELWYHVFSDTALNTFSEKNAQDYISNSSYKLIEKKKINTLKLKDILSKYLPSGKEIDFMSIDVEGFDIEVLKSNDWEKFRPILVLVEDLSNSSGKMSESIVGQFLIEKKYSFYLKTPNTMFFKDEMK